ncbi:Alpha/Beta hydrolase protein [Xylaria sp. CBS 124048]|nr:Alpha/Beta hydrolase protein [Xylaria sp. CBS 124048]
MMGAEISTKMSHYIKGLTEVDADEVESIHDIGPPPLDEDYVNPANKSPRWLLSFHAFALRLAAYIGFKLGNRGVSSPTERIWLDSTLGRWKGKRVISADIWLPADTPHAAKRPAVINFHGGGFILGSGTDDSPWAETLVGELGVVVFSVNYRLAPGYPFPTPVEDCVDAIIQIHALADRYNVDRDRIVLSGFSAGGNLAMSSWLVLQDPGRWNYDISSSLSSSTTSTSTSTSTSSPSTSSSVFPSTCAASLPLPRIAGLVLFYPMLDWTLDRPQKRKVCQRPDLTLPAGLTDLIDASYLYPPRPRRERDDVRLSPGLMPDDMIDRLPPVHLCLCEHDMLLAEGKLFAERIEQRGRRVDVRVVEGERHAWDKPLPFRPKDTAVFEYDVAISALRGWFEGVV